MDFEQAQTPTFLCKKCGEYFPRENFSKNRSSKDNVNSYCKVCANISAKAWRERNKEYCTKFFALRTKERKKSLNAYLTTYFAEHPCVDCGETDLVVLEFDHLRDKEYSIASMRTSGCFSRQKFLDEIAKCEVVCANCHRRRTAKRCNSWRTLTTEGL